MQLSALVRGAVVVLLWAQIARAEQFVLTDVTYTHSTETTNDSHYYPALPGDTPEDWTAPVDYAHGSVHIVLDVLTKPAGDAPTRLQVCFEGAPSYACTLQSPTYRTTGRVEWDSPFSSFWYESTVDWSQGVNKMPLILKDDMNNKPHGNASYMPTDLRVQVTLVSAGATFVAPSGGHGGSGGDGGEGGTAGESGGAGGNDEGQSGSGGAAAGAGPGGAGGGGRGGAGTMSGRPAAGGDGAGGQTTAGAAGSTAGAGGVPALPASNAGSGAAAGGAGTTHGGDESGCRAARTQRGAPWPSIAVFAYLVWRGRRRSSRRS